MPEQATLDPETGALTVFAVNRSQEETLLLESAGLDLKDYAVIEHISMSHADLKATHTLQNPNQVLPRNDRGTATIDGGQLKVSFSKLSWNVIRLARAAGGK